MSVWPEWLETLFRRVNNNAEEKEYYPVYNMLLTFYFPGELGYAIAPVTYPVSNRESIDFIVEYAVYAKGKPVLILEIKAPSLLRYISKRAEADAQIRHRFADLLEDCPISKLRAISAFGTKLVFYSADKATGHIEPIDIQNSINVITDTAPIQWWEGNDVLDKECSCKLLDIINTIKDDCNKIFIA